MAIKCPSCKKDIIDDKQISEAIQLGVSRLDLLDFASLINRRKYLTDEINRNSKRMKIILDKMRGKGWNVLVEKQQ